MSNDETFLQRWSRLKRKGEADVASKQEPRGAEPPAGEVDARPGSKLAADGTETEPLDLTKLPRLEDITAQTDVRAFLDSRVPAALRNAALQRIWTADPTIRDFIEVAENQWNWNIPGGAPWYGPLEPGTDIAALLAQATGAVNRAAVPVEAAGHDIVMSSVEGDSFADPRQETSVAAQHGDRGGTSDVQNENRASSELSQPSNEIAEHATIAALPAALQQHAHSNAGSDALAGRKRHGGAIPV